MHHAWIARLLVVATIAGALPSTSASQSKTATGSRSMSAHAEAAAPSIGNLQAFNLVSACDAHPGAPNCASAVARGAMLFAWTCANCSASWHAVFVVNGQPTAASDIVLAPSKLVALSARAGQFKFTDCVAVRLYNPANQTQNITSNAFCLAQLHAQTAVAAAPAAAASAPAAHPPSPCAPNTPCTAAPVKGTTSASAIAGARAQAKGSTAMKNATYDPTFVPAPTGLIGTTDPKVCSQHAGVGGGIACQAGLANGALALVWTCKNCKVDGYRVYRITSEFVPVAANGAYATDKSVTLALIDSAGGSFAGRCYTVMAYRGPNESAPGGQFCPGSGSVLSTVTLTPSIKLHWAKFRSLSTGTLNPGVDPEEDYYTDSMYVGFEMYRSPGSLGGDNYANTIHRTGLYFDLAPLAGQTVTKAVLRFAVQSSWHDVDANAKLTEQGTEACVTDVDKATDHWWTNRDLNATVRYISPGASMGPDFDIDVTAGVLSWLRNSKSNYGFVLRGGNENDQWHGPSSSACVTLLSSATLVVTYH